MSEKAEEIVDRHVRSIIHSPAVSAALAEQLAVIILIGDPDSGASSVASKPYTDRTQIGYLLTQAGIVYSGNPAITGLAAMDAAMIVNQKYGPAVADLEDFHKKYPDLRWRRILEEFIKRAPAFEGDEPLAEMLGVLAADLEFALKK